MGVYTTDGKTVTTPAGKEAMKLGGVSTPAPTSPSASFTVSPGITGTAPFNISVTSTSTGQSLTHSWDWGDGSPVESGFNQVPHTYTDAGSYTITLTITQTTDGQQDTSTANITVTASSGGGGGGTGSASLIKQTAFPVSAQFNTKDEWRNGWDDYGLGRYNSSGAQFTSSPITISNNILNIPFKTGDWGGAGWQNTGAIIYNSLPYYTGQKIYWKFRVKFSSDFDWGAEGEQFRGGKFGLSTTVGNVGVGSNPGSGNFQVTTMWRGGGLMHLYMYWAGQSGNWPDYDIYHTIQKGTWYDFELEIFNNDSGQSNGYVKIWIDGTLVKDKTGLSFGNGGSVLFKSAFGNFFGGDSSSWESRNDCNIQYGNMQVWDQRP